MVKRLPEMWMSFRKTTPAVVQSPGHGASDECTSGVVVKLVACIKATQQERLALILIAEVLLQFVRSSTGRNHKKRREHDCDPEEIAAVVAHRSAF
jgi:sensor histidine kinase regulating citrate/malate metabolism